MNRSRSLPAPIPFFRMLPWAIIVAALWICAALWVASMQGCAAIGAALPDIIAAIVDGGQILDAIAKYMGDFFALHPDPATQAKVDAALAKTRAALNVALRTARGVNGVRNEQVDQAFSDFEAAYLDLLALVGPYGVKAAKLPSSHLSAQPGGLTVPEPIAFRLASTKGS